MLSSLYPVATVALARLVLGERLTKSSRLGSRSTRRPCSSPRLRRQVFSPQTPACDTGAMDNVIASVESTGGVRPGGCDPDLADTAAFCEAYGAEDSANAILVVASRSRPMACCLVLTAPRRQRGGAKAPRHPKGIVYKRRGNGRPIRRHADRRGHAVRPAPDLQSGSMNGSRPLR